MHESFKIRDGIWQVQEAKGVYFTIIQGKDRAIIMDTGYGIADNRGYVEKHVEVPYIVINSHGHPDHTQGNAQFDEVYIHPLHMKPAIPRNGVPVPMNVCSSQMDFSMEEKRPL